MRQSRRMNKFLVKHPLCPYCDKRLRLIRKVDDTTNVWTCNSCDDILKIDNENIDVDGEVNSFEDRRGYDIQNAEDTINAWRERNPGLLDDDGYIDFTKVCPFCLSMQLVLEVVSETMTEEESQVCEQKMMPKSILLPCGEHKKTIPNDVAMLDKNNAFLESTILNFLSDGIPWDDIRKARKQVLPIE